MKLLIMPCLSLALALSSHVYANDPNTDQADNRFYAVMQQCLAGAELAANQGTQLDRYCIDSYLASVSSSPMKPINQ